MCKLTPTEGTDLPMDMAVAQTYLITAITSRFGSNKELLLRGNYPSKTPSSLPVTGSYRELPEFLVNQESVIRYQENRDVPRTSLISLLFEDRRVVAFTSMLTRQRRKAPSESAPAWAKYLGQVADARRCLNIPVRVHCNAPDPRRAMPESPAMTPDFPREYGPSATVRRVQDYSHDRASPT